MISVPKVLYEDNHLLVLEKPNNWLVQRDQTGDSTLTDWGMVYIKRKYNKQGNVFCLPCHRLDRPVGGVTVFARTSKALERMNELFRESKVEKTYLAQVQGVPKDDLGTLVHWLKKDEQRNVVNAYNKQKGKSKRAELSYALLATINGISLLKIKLVTGRTHQIRVQMRKLGCPIKGDLKYGYPHPNTDKSICLHAYKLAFLHPVKKERTEFISQPDWSNFNHFIK